MLTKESLSICVSRSFFHVGIKTFILIFFFCAVFKLLGRVNLLSFVYETFIYMYTNCRVKKILYNLCSIQMIVTERIGLTDSMSNAILHLRSHGAKRIH